LLQAVRPSGAKARILSALNGTAEEAAEKLRFWVAQRFKRCDKQPVFNAALAAEATPSDFFRSR